MASGRDVRDMLGLPMGVGGAEQKAVQKRPKASGGVRRIQGVAREVAALYGERPPPVAVYEEKKTYRAKRQSTGPAKKWTQQPFSNQARSDGLILKHWRRKHNVAPALMPDGEDAAMEEGGEVQEYVENSGEFAKYNISVDLPTFTDEEYDAHLRSDEWSREETDYLFDVVKDYSYRWAVIWDRYDYQPAHNSSLVQDGVNGETSVALAALPFAPTKARTVEDLKARFYDISAKLMKLRIPEMQMDADQYSLYETLTKFDPQLEKNRKTLAAALMNRNMDEVKEEEFLLTELQRINMAANRLDAEREELRARLEAPSPNPSVTAGLASFTSSSALQTLFAQLFQQDRSKKRPSGASAGPNRLSLNTNDLLATPGLNSSTTPGQHNRRQSTAASASASLTAQTPVRNLPPHEERRFNISTHDRLTSGVTFGSDKLLKMRQAKSNVQTQKIAAALAELGIPDVISIPTAKVGDVFENLVGRVGRLLDVRKVREKEEGECRVLEAMRARGGAMGAEGVDGERLEKSEIPDSQDGEADGEADGDGDGDEDEADATADADVDGDVSMGIDGDDDGDGDGVNADANDDNVEEEEDEEEEAEADADDLDEPTEIPDAEPDDEDEDQPDVVYDVDDAEEQEEVQDQDEIRDAAGAEDSRPTSKGVSTRAAAAAGHKRSASVISGGSARSQGLAGGNKRARR